MLIQFEKPQDVMKAAQALGALSHNYAMSMAIIKDFAEALNVGRDRVLQGEFADYTLKDAEELGKVAEIFALLKQNLDEEGGSDTELFDLLDSICNDFKTIRHSIRFKFGLEQSSFYNSKRNLKHVQRAFNKAFDGTVELMRQGKPIEFREV